MSEKRERKNGGRNGLTNEELAELAKKAGKRVMEYVKSLNAQENNNSQNNSG